MTDVRDAIATMGSILPDDVGGRDAVHVAVIAAVAGGKLHPGQHIGIKEAGFGSEEPVVGACDDPIGIVDPFLEASVKKGQRFWLYLYPRTITSLRHNWTHPKFSDLPTSEVKSPDYSDESRRWLENFAATHDETYGAMMEAAVDYLDMGRYFVRGGKFEGEYVPDEFWSHFERVTGRSVPKDDRNSFFSCSC